MRKDATPTPEVRRSDHAAIDAFVRQARAMAKPAGEGTGEGGGRLILALDATMSRQPTWDLACRLQGFRSSSSISAVLASAAPRASCATPARSRT
jgi:hypothetical protein